MEIIIYHQTFYLTVKIKLLFMGNMVSTIFILDLDFPAYLLLYGITFFYVTEEEQEKLRIPENDRNIIEKVYKIYFFRYINSCNFSGSNVTKLDVLPLHKTLARLEESFRKSSKSKVSTEPDAGVCANILHSEPPPQ